MTSKELITQLYVGYFDRAPDPEGLEFWIDVLEGGFPLDAIAQDFATQPEAVSTYPFLDDDTDVGAFIAAIYENLFDREPDAEGLAFWTGVLQGGFPAGSFILAIIDGASPADAAILQNKVDVACAWVELASEDDGFILSDAYIDVSRDALGEVSGDPESVTAAKAAADLFFQDGPSLALTNVLTTLPEDTDLTERLKVADIEITDDGIGTNVLSLSGTDADLFEIDGTELYLKAGTLLDFETLSALEVTVDVDDAGFGGSPDDAASLTLTITDANDAPSVALSGMVTELSEDADTSVAIKVGNIVVTDDALGTNVVTLTGADADLFEIVGDEIFLKAGTVLDFETLPMLEVTVAVDDTGVGETPDDEATLVINLTDANDAPTVTLENGLAAIDEDADTSAAIKIADIVIGDDALGTNVLSLSGADADFFEIVGTELFLKAGTALDFETRSSFDVTVDVGDADLGESPDDSALFSLAVGDVNEAPSVELTDQVTVLSEDLDTSTRVKVAGIVVSDDALGANDLSLSGEDADLFEIDGDALYLKAGAVLDFETNGALDVTVEVDDADLGGTPDDMASLSITLSDANDLPQVSLVNVIASVAEDADLLSTAE